jgi:hypothetical protein
MLFQRTILLLPAGLCPAGNVTLRKGIPKNAKVPGWLRLLLVGRTSATLAWLERRRPLRRAVEPKARREGESWRRPP